MNRLMVFFSNSWHSLVTNWHPSCFCCFSHTQISIQTFSRRTKFQTNNTHSKSYKCYGFESVKLNQYFCVFGLDPPESNSFPSQSDWNFLNETLSVENILRKIRMNDLSNINYLLISVSIFVSTSLCHSKHLKQKLITHNIKPKNLLCRIITHIFGK